MNRKFTIVGASLALAAMGCEEKKESGSALDKATNAVKDAANTATAKAGELADKAKDSAGEMLKSGQAAMTEKVNAMLTEWKPKVESIKAKVADATPEVKPQIEAAVKAIETQWTAVEGQLAKLKDASAETLQSAGTEAMGAAEKLGTMIKDAAAKYLK